jgi:hypothetical protein
VLNVDASPFHPEAPPSIIQQRAEHARRIEATAMAAAPHRRLAAVVTFAGTGE